MTGAFHRTPTDCHSAIPRPIQGGFMSICLYNGTLLSGFAVMERCAVLIEEGQIADVFSQKRFEQKKFSPSTKVYDVEGAYIVPGFIDTHEVSEIS